MKQLPRQLLAAYLLAGVIVGSHASGAMYRDARQSDRTIEDAMLIGGVAGIGASIGWPLYASAKVWGMRG